MTASAQVPLDFDDVAVDTQLPRRTWGPLTELHLMRWSSSIENWHRIHYDAPFATGHDGLPALLVNGSLKQHLLVQALRSWAGSSGWLWHLAFRFHGMDVVRDTLEFSGRITEVRSLDAFGVAVAEVELRNQRDEINTTGVGRVALPYRDGLPVPYPFPEDVDW